MIEPLAVVKVCSDLTESILQKKSNIKDPRSLFTQLWSDVELYRKPLKTFQHLENEQLEPKAHGFHKLSALLTEILEFLTNYEVSTSTVWGRAVRGVVSIFQSSSSDDSVPAQIARFCSKLGVLTPYVQDNLVSGGLFESSKSVGATGSNHLPCDDSICQLYYKARICGDNASLVALQHHVAKGNPLAKCYWNVMVSWGDVPGLTADHQVLEKETRELHVYLTEQLEAGQGFAALLLGINYELGIGVEKSLEEAFRLYCVGAEQGNTFALYNQGRLKETGKGTRRDIEGAVRAYIRASNKGHAMAQYAVGRCFMKGIGGDVDLREASRYCRLAADQGYALAQCGLGYCYEKASGLDGGANLKEAVRYYKMAADQGHSEAQYAQYNLGKCYEKGVGVAVNIVEAFRYYKMAADRGHVRAQWAVGFMYETGNGVARDQKEAAKYYQKSADAGNAASQFELAGMCIRGIRVPKDLEKAARYYKMAADQGNAAAQYEMGCCYKEGLGVPVDRAEALRFFKLSAARGNTLARNRISDLMSASPVPVRTRLLDAAPHEGDPIPKSPGDSGKIIKGSRPPGQRVVSMPRAPP